MKTLLFLSSFSLCIAQTTPVTVTATIIWDVNPDTDQVTAYNVKEIGQDGARTIVKEVSGTTHEAAIAIIPGIVHQYVVTAKNMFGESLESEVVSTPAGPPNAPLKAGWKKSVALETSMDMEIWTNQVELPIPDDQRYFVRATLTTR